MLDFSKDVGEKNVEEKERVFMVVNSMLLGCAAACNINRFLHVVQTIERSFYEYLEKD